MRIANYYSIKLKTILMVFLSLAATAGCRSPLEAAITPTALSISTADLVTATGPDPGEVGAASPELRDGCLPPYTLSELAQPNYRLIADVDISEHLVTVQESVVYPNTTQEQIDEIRFVVEPNWQAGAFRLDQLLLAGSENPKHLLADGYLDLWLKSPLPPGCSARFELGFTLSMPEQAGIYGYTEHQLVLTNWFPFIPPYQSGGSWQTHKPGNYGEHLVYPTADFEVSVAVSPAPNNWSIAAPAVAVVQGERSTYRLKNARTFSLAVLVEVQFLETSENGNTLQVYYRTANPRAARSALKTLGSAVSTFSELFGKYPFEVLILAEIEMFDGMEYDGIFFLGQEVFHTYLGTPENLLTLLAAHETSHNWWFSQVGNDQAIHPWLDEALATYSELLFLERVYPEMAGWWWDFRVNTIRPTGLVSATIFTYSDYERYRQGVYLRGVLFLEAIREEMGDELFLEFLQRYLTAGRDQIMDSDDFFDILEQVYPAGVDGLRLEYFGGR